MVFNSQILTNVAVGSNPDYRYHALPEFLVSFCPANLMRAPKVFRAFMIRPCSISFAATGTVDTRLQTDRILQSLNFDDDLYNTGL